MEKKSMFVSKLASKFSFIYLIEVSESICYMFNIINIGDCI